MEITTLLIIAIVLIAYFQSGHWKYRKERRWRERIRRKK